MEIIDVGENSFAHHSELHPQVRGIKYNCMFDIVCSIEVYEILLGKSPFPEGSLGKTCNDDMRYSGYLQPPLHLMLEHKIHRMHLPISFSYQT